MLHVESIELRLGFTQGHPQLAHLQHLVRMERTDAQGLAAVDDVFSQAERQGGDALLGLLFPDGIVVQGAEDTRDVRVEAAAVVLACHLLENDRHLLLVDDVARGSHVGLGVAVVDGGIDRLDGTRQHPQHLVLVFQTGYHIGGVNAGERLIVAVFQQRTRPHGNRRVCCLEECEEVGDERIGQLGMQESMENLVVGGIAEGDLVEVVLLHEAVEDIRTQDDRLRNLHRCVRESVEVGMPFDDIVEEGQSASFPAQRTVADAGEMGIAVELMTVEQGDDAHVAHPPVGDDGIEDDLPVHVHVLQLMPGDALQEGRYREDGAGGEPAAHVVA